MVTTGGMVPEIHPEKGLTEELERWSPGSFRNLGTAVQCTQEVPRCMPETEKTWAVVLQENRDWNRYVINEDKTCRRPKRDLVGRRRFFGG